LHKGRFGFAVSNFLALTPLNNTWDASWPSFFARRLEAQVTALHQEKQYGRAALNATDTELAELGMRVRAYDVTQTNKQTTIDTVVDL